MAMCWTARLSQKAIEVRTPVEAHLEGGLGGVCEEEVQDGPAFFRRQLVDVHREAVVHEEGLAPRHGMGAHDGMDGLWEYPVAVVDTQQLVGPAV